MAERTKKKREMLKKISVVDVRCMSNSCKKPNLSDIFNPIPLKPRNTLLPHLNHRHCHSSSSTRTATTEDSSSSSYSSTTTATSSPLPPPARRLGRVGGDGVAVEKDSDDPYLDFRRSMFHMILENEIYSKDDLRELLNCFLRLNAPFHHAVILRAFTDIWDGVFSSSSAKRPGTPALVAGPFDMCVSRDLF
ncbi:PREDICTED: transcription repressor OFP6-like [Tarenaya hassleriana]|uniref:transcription repressor OFP6-like n=1 Tax=Tarenaya hassleriana TaxID=28532 RepID=UPI00053C7A96|nr:PREDICTED: transcription repressor OFP6-like [Tarenaya hassleriana]